MKTLAALLMLASLVPLRVAASMPALGADLFASQRTAAGAGWATTAEVVERGTYTGSGLTGPYVTYTDTETGFSKTVVTLAGTAQSQGYDAHGSWQAQSGLVEPVEDAATVAQARTGAYVARNGWRNPKSDPATFEAAGQKHDGAATYDVVRVTPEGGDSVEVWIDTSTHLIGKLVETNRSNLTTTTTLSDYRATGGVMYPFATTVSTGDPKYDQHTLVTSVDLRPASTVADFTRPLNERTGTIAGGSSTTIPFEQSDPSRGHIIVRVSVNGSRPLRVIFDTGGSNVVTPEVARAIGLKGSGAVGLGGAGEQQANLALASGATLRIGAATLTDQPFGILALPPSLTHGGQSVDGVVGYEILKNFIVRIDYVHRTLTLIDPATFHAASSGTPVRFKSATVPVIPVTFGGVSGEFMVDTGNAFYNTVSQAFLDAHGLASKLHGNVLVQSSGNIGGAVRSRLARAGEIAIGPYDIAGPIFAVTDTKAGDLAGTAFAGNLGESILTRFDLTFDYANSIIYFKPNARFGHPFAGDFDGMSLYVTPGGALTVSYVNPGSPSAKAGLAAGDRIVSVKGVAASRLDTGSIAMQAVAGKPVVIVYARGSATRTATLLPVEQVP